MKTKYAILIAGKSGAGKDTLKNMLFNYGDYHSIVTSTTRPIREGEVDGVSYHFLSELEMLQKIYDGSMIEAVRFNDWVYGTSLNSLSDDKVNLGVYNPEGIEILSESSSLIPFIVYVKCNDKVRLMRALNREENPDVLEIIRRFGADDKDFLDFEDCADLIIDSTEGLNQSDLDLIVQKANERFAF